MYTKNEFYHIRLPSKGRMLTLAFIVMVVMSMLSPMPGLTTIRNELGAFAGTICLLLLVHIWLKKDGLGFAQLLSETTEKDLNYRLKRVLKLLALCIIALIVTVYVAYGIFYVLDHVTAGRLLKLSSFEFWLSKNEHQKNQYVLGFMQAAPFWGLFWYVCVAPILEELFFRRFLYVALRKKYGFAFSILTTSLLFGLIHAPIPLVFMGAVAVGGFLGYLYEKQKDFAANVVFHMLNNVYALFILWAVKL